MANQIKKLSEITWQLDADYLPCIVDIKAAIDGLVIDGNIILWDELLAARDKVQGFTELGIRRT